MFSPTPRLPGFIRDLRATLSLRMSLKFWTTCINSYLCGQLPTPHEEPCERLVRDDDAEGLEPRDLAVERAGFVGHLVPQTSREGAQRVANYHGRRVADLLGGVTPTMSGRRPRRAASQGRAPPHTPMRVPATPHRGPAPASR
mmetsp:Transcript_69554/g.192492  ORF Transcript_69554/g.192492 Transcript_69554/m.192492 type:complete len:143 (+) Transcript_69554:116-544(+)